MRRSSVSGTRSSYRRTLRGGAYLTDVTFVLWKCHAEYYSLYQNDRPTEAELLLAMELDLGQDRFQVSALCNDYKRHNIMVRAVQGHSGRIGDKVKNDLAFCRVPSVECLNHYYKMAFMNTIVGWNGRGLVAGGML